MRNSSNGNKPNLKEERTIETIKLPCEISRTFQKVTQPEKKEGGGTARFEGNKETWQSTYIHTYTYVQIEYVTVDRL